jgi:hypothetical protein
VREVIVFVSGFDILHLVLVWLLHADVRQRRAGCNVSCYDESWATVTELVLGCGVAFKETIKEPVGKESNA